MLLAHRCTILPRDSIPESNAEFIRFLCYAKRSCTEVQSELYVALDEGNISSEEFNETYELAGRTRAAIRGFINYLKKYAEQKVSAIGIPSG